MLQPSSADIETLCDEAWKALEMGHLPRALDLIHRARAIAPHVARVHYLLGLYHSDSRNAALSLDAFENAIRLDPTNAKAHNNRGSALEQLGRTRDAEAAFRTALELDQKLAQPYINLGHLLEQRGALAEAADVYAEAIAIGLDRAMFEQYRAVASGTDTEASPESWVRSTFDNFAPVFDQRLRSLGYSVPEDLARILLPGLARRVDILDLGCGTGFCGVAFASRKARLIGVDLSEKMLHQAAARGVYDELVVAEATDYLEQCVPASFDLVIAADVFVYFGALEPVFEEAARVLRPAGTFAFSTEEGTRRDFALLPSGRYAHSYDYIRRIASGAFTLSRADPIVVRKEAGRDLAGRLYILGRM
jgi:predicted TPR repeat methyltransferase